MQKAKIGGNERLRLFMKGNEDLTSSLLSRQEGGQWLEQGFQELVHEKHNGTFQIEWVHETAAGSDLLCQQMDGLAFPAELRQQGIDDPFITTQFQSQLAESEADIVVLSIQSDLRDTRWQHKRDGYLICPPCDWKQAWSAAQREWFTTHFAPVGLVPAQAFKENLTRLVQYLKGQRNVHVIIYGCSSLDPDDRTHNYHGIEDTLSLRVHRFNLALLEISWQEGISFVDVDRLIAEMGGARHVTAALHYSPEAYQAIGQEFLRLVADIGFFEKRPLLMQMGQRRQ